MNAVEFVDWMDLQWAEGGILSEARDGIFREEDGRTFVERLASVDIADGSLVPKRLLSVLWMLPIFLHWQRDRVAEFSGNLKLYDQFCSRVTNVLGNVVGVP